MQKLYLDYIKIIEIFLYFLLINYIEKFLNILLLFDLSMKITLSIYIFWRLSRQEWMCYW